VKPALTVGIVVVAMENPDVLFMVTATESVEKEFDDSNLRRLKD
jgi:hypothetical protein